MKHKFCIGCGAELKSRKVPNSYDGETGEQLIEAFCPNLKCRYGCGESEEGHLRPKFMRSTCRRCGAWLSYGDL